MLNELLERYPVLKACEKEIEAARELLIKTYENNGKVLCCGNGGSCSDSEHIVGELMKGFISLRPVGNEFMSKLEALGFEDAEYITKNLQGSLPAIALGSQSGILSAFANDVAADMVYGQMAFGYAQPNDVLIGLSTSGNSKNVVYAAKVAKAKGAKCIALTGARDSKLSAICDVTIKVPETETFKVQELHLPVYHYLCASVEKHFFG